MLDKKTFIKGYLDWIKANPNYSPISIGEYVDGSEEWLKAREHGKDYNNPLSPDYIPFTVGGSTVAKILGVSPYGTKLETWVEKTKNIVPKYEKEKPSDLFSDGHDLEEWVAKSAARLITKETGAKVEMFNDTNMYQHPYPLLNFVLANVDRRMTVNGVEGLFEAKTTSNWEDIKKYWQPGIVPEQYEPQIRLYMGVTNRNYCYIGCCWMPGDTNKSVILVKRDLQIEAEIFYEAYKFQCQCEAGLEPELENENLDELSKYYTRLYGEIPEDAPAVELPDTPDVRLLVQDIQDIAEEKKKLEARLKDVEERENKYVCEIVKMTGGETTYATYRLDDENVLGIKLKLPMKRDGFDEEKLKATDEGLYKKYLKTEEKFDVTKFKKENKSLATQFVVHGGIDATKPYRIKDVSVRTIPLKKD